MFKDVVGYEGHYRISDDGIVWSDKSGHALQPAPNKQVDYLQVSLWKENVGRSFYVHRLVATHFIPNPLGLPEVNHLDGDRHNNHVTNLEWVTSSGNSYHAVATGLRIYTNRLTRDEFIECLNAVLAGESYASLCDRVPYKVPFLSVKLRKLAKELNLEPELDESLRQQRAERNRQALTVINAKRATTSRKA